MTNKELRTANRLARQVRKFRNIIDGHHLLAIATHLKFGVKEDLLKNSPTFKTDFTESFELSKQLQSKVNKVLELEGFIKILYLVFFWRQKNFEECMQIVKDLLAIIDAANRRTLDPYDAILYFYFIRLHEKNGTDLDQRGYLL